MPFFLRQLFALFPERFWIAFFQAPGIRWCLRTYAVKRVAGYWPPLLPYYRLRGRIRQWQTRRQLGRTASKP